MTALLAVAYLLPILASVPVALWIADRVQRALDGVGSC